MRSNSFTPAIFITVLLLVFHASCISISPSEISDDLGDETGSTSFFKACVADDYECYGESLSLLDENFDDIELVEIGAELPEADGEFAPEIISATAEITLSLDEPLQLIEMEWTDPTLSTPAFCVSLCPRDTLCAPMIRCTRAKFDGLVTGTWRAYVYSTAFPDGATYATQDLDLTVTPMASLTGEDPVTIITDGSFAEALTDVAVGESVIIPQRTTGPAGDDDSADNSDSSDGFTDDETDALSCTDPLYDCLTGRCVSTRLCAVSGSDCECAGEATPGTCVEITTCSGSGGVCDDGVHECCVGYSCNNGICEDAGGSCPF